MWIKWCQRLRENWSFTIPLDKEEGKGEVRGIYEKGVEGFFFLRERDFFERQKDFCYKKRKQKHHEL